LQCPGQMNQGRTRVSCLHSPHGVCRGANPLRKILLSQVPAPARERNSLTEPGQAAYNGQWWRR